MSQTLQAVYENGAFVPSEDPSLPEGTRVRLTIEPATIHPPTVTDPVERRRGIEELIARMRSQPMRSDRPHFTRDELHDGR